MKNRGARAQSLARCRALQELAKIVSNGVQQHEIAVECGVSKSTVTRWFSRECEPSDENKATMKRKWGIELSWWAQPELLEAAASPPAEDLEKLKNMSLRERARRYQQIVDEALLEANLATASPAKKMQMIREASRTMASLGKITGETRDLSESQIVKTAAWSRLCTKVMTALAPWPEALLAFGHALRDLDLEDR